MCVCVCVCVSGDVRRGVEVARSSRLFCFVSVELECTAFSDDRVTVFCLSLGVLQQGVI